MTPVQANTNPFITIIIPTFRDWARLGLCLNALTQQTYPNDSFEIIIANNDPADQPPGNFVLPTNGQLINVAKVGSYAARNAALKIARGTIIGFTDSDCIPNNDWITNAVGYLQANPNCWRVAGRIEIIYSKKNPSTSELYNNIYAFQQEMHVKKTGTSVTANLFTYKELFEKVSGFDEQLLSLGDLSWGRKVKAAGYSIAYVPSVVVHHPSRNFKELVKKEKRVGGGAGRITKGKISSSKLVLNLLNGLRPRIKEIKYIMHNGQNMGPIQKLRVILIRHYLLTIRTYEQIRVTMGKEPNRA